MRKRADVPIAKQPGDLRNRELWLGQVSICQVAAKAFQDIRKGDFLGDQSPRKRPLTDAKMPGNLANLGLAVRQQRDDGVFDPGPE